MNHFRHEELLQKSKEYVWLPFTQMKDYDQNPLIIAEGEGIYLKDTEGNKYYDGNSSVWLNVHGHNNKFLNEAINRQLEKISHSTLLGMANVPAVLLAEKLVQLAPSSLKRVFYSDSGATAVEIALKMAFQYWQNKGFSKKKKFITMNNGYHGDTIGAVSVGAVDLFHKLYKPLLFDSYKVPYPYTYRHESSEAEVCKEECLFELEKILVSHHEEIAALICEPIMQGAGGMIRMPDGYLSEVASLCRKYDVLLITDEVATGFGRTGEWFACDHENVEPDIMTVAKGLTGGYLPVAATLTTEKIYEAFYDDYEKMKTFFHGHSYTGNQLGCTVALANIELFEQNKVIENVQTESKKIAPSLESLKELPHVGDVRGIGFMVGVELVKNKETKEPFPWEERMGYQVTLKMRELGMISRPMGDVLVFMPPLITQEKDLREMIHIMRKAIQLVTERKAVDV